MTDPAPGVAAPQEAAEPGRPAAEEAAAPVLLDEPPASRTAAPVGPGILEALVWIAGFFLLEIVGSAVWVAGVVALDVATHGPPLGQERFEALIASTMPWMLGAVKLLEVAAALAALRLRFGKSAFRATGFRAVPATHAVALGLAVLPTAILSGQCYALLLGPWEALAEDIPFLKALDDQSSIKSVQEMAETTPLAVLVLVIAVLPALNEEFLFRAAVGRGLVGRYGLVAGVALTSLLFAAVHVSPLHAAALIPLAVLMHVGYLSSGSIWACVGVHFLNNAISVAFMKLATVTEEVGGVTTDVAETTFSPILFAASAACVAATVWLLLGVRARWVLADGREWPPPFLSVEPPPAGVTARRVVPKLPAGPLWAAGLCYAAFPVALGVAASLRQL